MTLKEQLKSWKPRKKVIYKGVEVSVKSVLLDLEKENRNLRKDRCKPSASCFFKYNDYMDKFVKRMKFKVGDIIEID